MLSHIAQNSRLQPNKRQNLVSVFVWLTVLTNQLSIWLYLLQIKYLKLQETLSKGDKLFWLLLIKKSTPAFLLI